MKELSLNVLDVTLNSVKARATLITIAIEERGGRLTIRITDNGTGMTDEILRSVTDPFCTTRTTRKVGLGIPLLKMAAEMTGGDVRISSRHYTAFPEDHGTEVTAVFHTDHIDCPPMGDLIATVTTLVQGSPDVNFVFSHVTEHRDVHLDTRELRAVLGEEISLASPEILTWIGEYLAEQYQA